MRYRILLSLFFMGFTTLNAIADDALMLPVGVWRFINIFSSAKIDKKFNNAGKKVTSGEIANNAAKSIATGTGQASLDPQIAPETSIFRYDFVAEYGILKQLGAQLWLPFYLSGETTANPNANYNTLTTAVTTASQSNALLVNSANFLNRTKTNGDVAGLLGDILVGAKWQFLATGDSPIDKKAGTFRGALAGGAYLPTGSLADPMKTLDIGTTTHGSKSFIPGFRTYFDYQATTWFYLNWMTETQFPFKGKAKKLNSSLVSEDGKYKHGKDFYTELDFTFEPKLSENLSLDAGYIWYAEYSSKGEYSGFNTASINAKSAGTRVYGHKPYLGVFYTGSPFPVKGTFSYTMPYAGRNVNQTKVLSLRIEAYLKF